MANAYLECNERFITGAIVNLSIVVWDESNPDTDISAATASLAVYSEVGAVILPDGSCTVTGTTLLTVQRLFNTTSITGRVRAVVTVNLGSVVKKFQFAFEIDPLPGPQ